MKISPSTLVISPDDQPYNDIGEGHLNIFEYLKHTIKGWYPDLNPKNYFERYFCFQRNQPFHPTDAQLMPMATIDQMIHEINLQVEHL